MTSPSGKPGIKVTLPLRSPRDQNDLTCEKPPGVKMFSRLILGYLLFLQSHLDCKGYGFIITVAIQVYIR